MGGREDHTKLNVYHVKVMCVLGGKASQKINWVFGGVSKVVHSRQHYYSLFLKGYYGLAIYRARREMERGGGRVFEKEISMVKAFMNSNIYTVHHRNACRYIQAYQSFVIETLIKKFMNDERGSERGGREGEKRNLLHTLQIYLVLITFHLHFQVFIYSVKN